MIFSNVFFAVTMAVYLVCVSFDVYYSTEGLRAKLSQESNELVDKIFGTNYPTFRELFAFEMVVAVLLVLAWYFTRTNAGQYAVLGFITGAGIKHVIAALHWERLLAKRP